MDQRRVIEEAHGQAIMANNLGKLKNQHGDHESALRYFQVALDHFTSMHVPYGMAATHMNIGITYLYQQMFDHARSHLDQSKALRDQVDAKELFPALYRLYAELAFAERQFPHALEWITQSLTWAQCLKAPFEEGESLRIRGDILRAVGNYQDAMVAFRQACALLGGAHDSESTRTMVYCLKELAHMVDDRSEAVSLLMEAQRLHQDTS
jgi:tetratricopeptide (TPR) repeat protein